MGLPLSSTEAGQDLSCSFPCFRLLTPPPSLPKVNISFYQMFTACITVEHIKCLRAKEHLDGYYIAHSVLSLFSRTRLLLRPFLPLRDMGPSREQPRAGVPPSNSPLLLFMAH